MKLKKLDKEVTAIYDNLVKYDPLARKIGNNVHPNHRWSAVNLLRYLVLRTYDLRRVHDGLSENGISSLRSGEGYTLKNVIDALKLIRLIQGKTWKSNNSPKVVGYQKSKRLLHEHTNGLFNEKDRKCFTEIMVTLPSEASENKKLVHDLIAAGMEIARINLSHDTKAIWLKQHDMIRKQSKALQIPCKVVMDLGGPKIRTKEMLVRRKGKHFLVDKFKVKNGDAFFLLSGCYGKPLKKAKKKSKVKFVGLSVNLPSILEDLKIGDPVFFDDGKFGAKVLCKMDKKIKVVIESGAKLKRALKVGKGINVPQTNLKLESLTKDDLASLPFALRHADIIGYSFVRRPSDVASLFKRIGRRLQDIGIILKIENLEAFRNLPLILLEAMKCPKLGVMIARGDLAVEVGPERMSEIQDEIIWICEAAHIP